MSNEENNHEKFLLGAVALASIAVATSAHAVGITRVSAADFVAGSGLITFSEFANGTVNPTYAPAVYGGDAASPTVTFDGWFLGQSLSVNPGVDCPARLRAPASSARRLARCRLIRARRTPS
ncbi:hypothetical protein [Hankyongella ginsenosidimutans]|uniref:hypothetical protein n=1 Tax=Hankyongella ginsenosidimutans TaxID=1763828 RepID=UPI001CA34EA5|nr:hypothetical protein [Hankyongella ginsenosidimutans]